MLLLIYERVFAVKGSKKDRWLKDGIKESKKHYKKLWNRRVRHTKETLANNEYRKLGSAEMYNYVP